MLRTSVALLAFAALPFAAYADDASKTAKVEEFFRLTKMDETLKRGMELVSNQMKSGMMEKMTGVKMPPEQQKSLDEFQGKVTRLIFDSLSWDKLKPAYIKLYADSFTEAELDDVISFYKSPSGQSMVAKNAELMPKASTIVQERMAVVYPEIQKLMSEFAAQAGKR